MRRKQSMALLFAAVSSVAIYSEVQAAEIIESSDFAVESYFQGAVQLPVQESRVVASSDLRVVTNLNDLQQIIYEEMQNFTTTFQVQYKGNTKELDSKTMMNLLIKAKEKDNYLLGTVISYGFNLKGYENDVTLTINLGYTTNAEQEAFVKSEVKRLVAELITPSMSDVEKVKVINEYIVKKTTYSDNTQASPHAAYTILTEGKGVCQAYATLAYMMLTEAGMEAHYVTGFAREPHAWNLVKVDGQWYHLDPTWNDPTFVTSFQGLAEYISYDYFLISDSVISQDHTMDERSGLPAATSERFSALRNGLSRIIEAGGIPYVLVPEYVDGYLYYVNYSDSSYAINRINLLASVPTVESFAAVKAMDILATDQAIYFVDTRNNMGLSKIDLATKQVTTLHTADKIHSIKKDAQNVYAYSNGRVVFSEPYAASEPKPIERPVAVKEIDELVATITYLNKNFATQAQQLLAKLQKLTEAEKQFLSQETLDKTREIEVKYEKMKSLSFAGTNAWNETIDVKNPRKPWTITLSQTVKNTQDNLKNIQVVDMFGDPVNVSIKIDGKTITVTPNTEYVADIPYTLVIQPALENEQGAKLQQGTHLTFTFK